MPKKVPWYFQTWFIVLMFIFLLPIGIILAAFNPHWKRNTRIVVTAIGLLFLVAGIVAASTTPGGGEPEVPKPRAEKPPEEKEERNVVNRNQTLKVGEVEWNVLSVEKTKTIGDPDFEPETAAGIFVVIKMRAELVGKEGGTVDSSQFKLINSEGREHEPSPEAETALEMEGKKSLFLRQINPNNPIEGWIAFDISPDAKNLELKIKDFALSGEEGFIKLGM